MLKEIKKESDVITNADLFNEIISKVKESGKWPDDLVDYALPSNYDKTGLYNYAFDPQFVLKPGSNEGYYLDLAIYGNFSLTDSVNSLSLGTIKTLDESEDGVRKMADLYGECLIAYTSIMNDNLDAFTRKGYDLHFLDKEGKRLGFGYSGLKDLESALEEFQRFHDINPETYCEAVIRNNLTRKEKLYG